MTPGGDPHRDVTIDKHRVHYVDAGSGPTVVFVHGSPTSGALWRHQLAAFTPQARVIVPDLLGFG